VLCVAAPVWAALSTTAYPSGDTWLDAYNEWTNYGNDYYLRVYGATSQGQNVPKKNTLVRFSLPSLPNGYHIQSATVRMNYCAYEDMDSNDYVYVGLYAVRPTRTWTELGANWYTMNGSSYWAQAGCEDPNYDRYDTLLGSQLFSRSTSFGDKDWTGSSLTQTVRDWYSGSLTNNGIVARTYQHYSGAEGVVFYSKNYGSGWGPRLLISYTLDAIAEANGPYTVGPGGSVLFNAAGSYDPDGGSLTSYLWDLDNDGQYDDGSGLTFNASFSYLVDTLGLTLGQHTIGLKVVDDEGEWGTDTSLLTITPEPATLALLVLGGIAALRRRQ
jgi:hypothetical protein